METTQHRPDRGPGDIYPEVRPQWWTDSHTSGWDRIKEAFRRDWEQTKHDFGADSAPDLDQDVDDTVKQAVGKQRIPPGDMPNPPEPKEVAKKVEKAEKKLEKAEKKAAKRWEDAEPAARYGFGAASYYKDHTDWDDRLESRLSSEWNGLNTGRTWNEVKSDVHHGWVSGRNIR